MGVSKNQIHNWKKRVRDANAPVENEMIALKKKLREVEMERDILKIAGVLSYEILEGTMATKWPSASDRARKKEL